MVNASPFMFGGVQQVVTISDGRAFVVDAVRRLVWLVNADLQTAKIVLDSAPGKNTTFNANSFLVAFRADSVLLYDARSNALVVIGATGQIGRTMVSPSVNGGGGASVVAIPTLTFGNNLRWSTRFGLVYEVVRGGPEIPVGRSPSSMPEQPRTIDSAVILRWNHETQPLPDTITTIAAETWHSMTRNAAGSMSIVRNQPTLIPFGDKFTTTSDGTLAILRSREFRLEWHDGSKVVKTSLPYSWQTLSDADRQTLVDSVNASRMAKARQDSVRRAGAGPVTLRMPQMATLAEANESYYPPTRGRAVISDTKGNVWIRINVAPKAAVDSNEWLVVAPGGAVVDHVQLPIDRQFAAFGSGDTIWLLAYDGGLCRLERWRIR